MPLRPRCRRPRCPRLLPLLAAAWALLLAPLSAHGRGDPPTNVLLVIADDLGTDVLGIYTPGPDAPPTPVIDVLAANGVVFRQAYASPNCSPSRASMLTGRYPFRHHLGSGLQPWETFALPDAETTLPEVLAQASEGQIETAAIGKWHLSTENVGGGLLAPNVNGFDHYDGTLYNLYQNGSLDYYQWHHVVNGVKTTSNEYATTAQVDAALDWIDTAREPWFCYLAFSAPHIPFQLPPEHLYTVDTTGGDPDTNPRPIYNAMVEALDTELGRLLTSMDPAVLANTTIVFVGDNGTPNQAAVPPFSPDHAKGTVYEGGVHVPLIVAGPNVAAGENADAFVHVVDLFPTITELLGVDAQTELAHTTLDGDTLTPWFSTPSLPTRRTEAFSEWYYPNTDGTPLGQPFCQLDVGFGNGATNLRVCGDRLNENGQSTLTFESGMPNVPTFLAIALSADPLPFAGGALVPELPFLVFLTLVTDAQGRIVLPIEGGLAPFGVPYSLYMQFIAAGNPGWELSNGVALAFEDPPKNKRMLRDERFKYIRRTNVIGGVKLNTEELYDLLADPFELTDLLLGGALDVDALAAYQALKSGISEILGS